ncbi:MAG: biotin/lipoyl-containing protein [Desulfatiglandaceae bacterium]
MEVKTVGEIIAPMAGKVIDVRVKVGDQVSEGDEVVVIEAMKMEIPVVASESGTVAEIACREGDAVEADGVLVELS